MNLTKLKSFYFRKLLSSTDNDVEDELEKLLMSELVPQLHELASRSGECQEKLQIT